MPFLGMVDEKGTEAAAVIGIGMAATALPPEPIERKRNQRIRLPYSMLYEGCFFGSLFLFLVVLGSRIEKIIVKS